MPLNVAPTKKAFLDALASDMSADEAKYLVSLMGGVAGASGGGAANPPGANAGHVAGLAGSPWSAYLKGMEVVETAGTETSFTPENIWGVGSADPPVQRFPFVPDTIDQSKLDLSLNGEHGSIVVGCTFAKGASPRMRILVDMALGEGDAVPPGAAGAPRALLLCRADCSAQTQTHSLITQRLSLRPSLMSASRRRRLARLPQPRRAAPWRLHCHDEPGR